MKNRNKKDLVFQIFYGRAACYFVWFLNLSRVYHSGTSRLKIVYYYQLYSVFHQISEHSSSGVCSRRWCKTEITNRDKPGHSHASWLGLQVRVDVVSPILLVH